MCVSVFIIIANGIAKEEAMKEEMIDIKKEQGEKQEEDEKEEGGEEITIRLRGTI